VCVCVREREREREWGWERRRGETSIPLTLDPKTPLLQVRKLVEKLEGDEEAGLELAHPCTTHFGPRPSDPPPRSESHHPIHHVHFYVGYGDQSQSPDRHIETEC
jgi:hypothetical protein